MCGKNMLIMQLAELLPERMEQQRFFRQWIAQLPDPLCGPNWSYWVRADMIKKFILPFFHSPFCAASPNSRCF
jgi:hypothetical protein